MSGRQAIFVPPIISCILCIHNLIYIHFSLPLSSVLGFASAVRESVLDLKVLASLFLSPLAYLLSRFLPVYLCLDSVVQTECGTLELLRRELTGNFLAHPKVLSTYKDESR